MLEQLRKSGASVAIYLIFGLLIIIFVINFAPNAGQGKGGAGCAGMSGGKITVGSSKASESAFHVAYSANKYGGRQKIYAALEMLIRREILADAAAERGIRVTPGMIEEEIKKGVFYYAGFRIPDYGVDPQGGPAFVSEHSFFDIDKDDGQKFWNTGKFKGWVNSLNVSVGSYKDEQARAMQAAMMSELIQESVRVSRDEAMNDYLFAHNTVTYDTVTFAAKPYRDAMRLGDADVARFLSTHEAEVKKKYADDERTYKSTNPALKLRAIQIAYAKPEAPTTPEKPAPTDDKKPADDKQPGDKKSDATKADDKKAGSGATPAVEAKADDKKAGSGATPPVKVTAADGSSTGLTVTEVKPGDKKPDTKAGADAKKPAGIPLADAKAKLEAARTAITSGKQKFADAAKALTTDEATKFNGGDMGWRPVQNAQLGDQAVNDAIKALKPGETTAVIVGESAVFLVTAEAKREGDLAYDAVKDEIATELAKDVWSKEAAKRAALDALATSHAGAAKNLTDLFERGVNEETERRRMQQLIEQQIGDQHGSIERPMKDIPAAWRGDDETPPASGGGSAPPATGSAAPKAGSAAPTAGSAAPKAGSAAPAAGSAAPAAGSGAGSATTTTPPAPPAPPAELVASKDVLPAFGDVKKPKVIPQGPVAREKSFPALEGVTDAGAILFDELQAGMLGKKVYETPDGFTLIQLTDKQQPKVEDFDKIADAEMAKLRSLRGRMAVEAWLKTRCKQLKDDGKIKPAADLVAEHDDAGKALPQVYQPCMSFR